MAEGLQVAELAFKIYNELSTFIERVKNAEKTAKDLRYKIQRFRKAVEIVHLAAEQREKVSLIGHEHRVRERSGR